MTAVTAGTSVMKSTSLEFFDPFGFFLLLSLGEKTFAWPLMETRLVLRLSYLFFAFAFLPSALLVDPKEKETSTN